MAWEDFTLGKRFGNGIFRPYSDWLGDFESILDQILASDTPFASKVVPLKERDVAILVGDTMSIVAIAGTMQRHLPTRFQLTLKEALGIEESEAIRLVRFEGESVLLSAPGALGYFEGQGFVDVIGLAIPSIWSAPPASQELQKRNTALLRAAWIFMSESRKIVAEQERPKDIFLSHKTTDIGLVREVAYMLKEIGFSPWLYEDKMPAGTLLERGIDQGFRDSCAAVFFLTPNFADEGVLATEVDYAIREKRTKGDRFAIISLLLKDSDGRVGVVPNLLQTYVWKEVSDIEILRVILEALPVKAASIVWK